MQIRSFVPFLLLALGACGDGAGAGGSGPDPKTPESGGKSPITIACKGQPTVGNKAPDLSFESLNDQGTAKLTPGKVTIIDFWATWCAPCKESFPKYQDLYVKYKASGLEIMAVSVDDEDSKSKIPDFAKTAGAKFPVGWDKGHVAADCFKPDKMPTAVIVDKKGVVRFVHAAYKPGEEAEIEKEVKSLL
jgi:thiol-disulfide isomerase/thioredoxin